MGPLSRYLGPEVPKQRFIWQDPLPSVSGGRITPGDETALKAKILGTSGLTVSNLVAAAWGSASTFRNSDKRGGANGARIALQPQVGWAVNNPSQLKTVLSAVRVSLLPSTIPLKPLLTIVPAELHQIRLQRQEQRPPSLPRRPPHPRRQRRHRVCRLGRRP